ncbi:unnamed protein product, partial [marine sediment metagenome]
MAIGPGILFDVDLQDVPGPAISLILKKLKKQIMIGEQFYPTPKKVIEKMLLPYKTEKAETGHHYRTVNYKLENLHILDPSAGKGDILDFMKDQYHYNNINLYAIEIDSELQYTLQGKSYQVIGTDFLKYSGDLYFDMIIMNPPFDHGADHLLKALDYTFN